METTNELVIAAPVETVFQLASEVERWPELLPHYRWVRVLERGEGRKLVEMAARRDRIPVRWRAEQRLYPREGRITFRHVGGATRGMEVEWTLEPTPSGTRARIWHRFEPRWPLAPDWLVELVVGRFFVSYIAGRTLRRIKALAEIESRGSNVGSPESAAPTVGLRPSPSDSP